MQFFVEFIWQIRKMLVILHPQTRDFRASNSKKRWSVRLAGQDARFSFLKSGVRIPYGLQGKRETKFVSLFLFVQIQSSRNISPDIELRCTSLFLQLRKEKSPLQLHHISILLLSIHSHSIDIKGYTKTLLSYLFFKTPDKLKK